MRERSLYLWAALAVGFCLAAREMRLYTAIFQYETLSFESLLVSVSFVTLMFGLAVPLLRKMRQLPSLVLVFLVLTVLQELSSVMQGAYALGLASKEIYQFCAPMEECYSIGLVVIAVASARRFGENSVLALIGGFAFSGLLQLATALLKWEVALGLIVLFPLAAFVCFSIFVRMDAVKSLKNASMNGGGVEAESGNVLAAEMGVSELFGWRLTRGEAVAMILSFFLMGALLISTHATRMSYQDGGSYSMAIQVLSGLGGIAAAAILFVFNRRLAGMTRLALVYLLILPVLLVALYATSLFENIAVLVLLVFFHRFVYGLVYYFVWLLCFVPRAGWCLSDRFVAAFYALKLGWAAGVLCFMIMPSGAPEGSWSVVLIVFFFALGLVDIFLFIGMLRAAEKGLEENAATSIQGSVVEVLEGDIRRGYDEACRTVAESYGLTRREAEVLAYLGKGRTAAYIREKMFISDGTARTHIDHIYKKLGVHSQQALIDVIDRACSDQK